MRRLLPFFVFVFLGALAHAQNQVLVPQKVYVGDTAELRISFSSDSAVFDGFSEKESWRELATGYFVTEPEQLSVKKIGLKKSGIDFYTLVITFVPWSTGELEFPAYDAGGALGKEEFLIEISAVNVVSILERGQYELRELSAPFLLPGTLYKIWAAIVAAVILLAVAVRLLVKHRQVAAFVRQLRLRQKFRRNRREAVKALDRLEPSVDDRAFASAVQQIMRTYLEVRFDFPFTRTVSSEIMKAFFMATGAVFDATREAAVQQIAAHFVRTDFIRYAHDSFEDEKPAFHDGERAQMVASLKACIETIERKEESDA